MTTYKLLLEALTSKQIELVDRELGGDKYKPSSNHKNIFLKGIDRIKIPLTQFSSHEVDDIRNSVRKRLNQLGYDIEDYKEGLASQEYIDKLGNHRKKIVKIGKILQNKGYLKELKEFTYDPLRSKIYNESDDKEYQVTLTRDKYDIAGMTSGRDWENQSCMELPNDSSEGGSKYRRIKDDLKNHTLVAYLTKKGDDEIEAPLGRVLIKKYTSNEKVDGKYHHIWRPDDKIYGNVISGFHETVKNYMVDKYPAIEGVGYSLAKGLYPQSETEIKPIQRGIVRNDNTIQHYNQNGELHDYIDENGVLQPAVKNLDSGEYAHYQNGKLHKEGDLPASTLGDSITYSINGQLHRDGNNPAVYKKDGSSNFYYRYGLLHRPYGKPALNSISKDNLGAEGTLKSVEYREYGLLHREGDLPTIVKQYNGFDKILGKGVTNLIKEYHIRGVRHRNTDKPSVITKSKIGEQTQGSYSYYKNGKLHREGDKPSHIEYGIYDATDNKLLFNKKYISKSWFKNGKPSRYNENLPTKIISVNGEIIKKEYSHENPFKPYSVERYPEYTLNQYKSYEDGIPDKKEYVDNHDVMERLDGVGIKMYDYDYPSSFYYSNLHGLKGVSNGFGGYYNFNVNGINHLAHIENGNVSIYKNEDGRIKIHQGYINNVLKTHDHKLDISRVKNLIEYAKQSKYDFDTNDDYKTTIDRLDGMKSNNVNHLNSNFLKHLTDIKG